MTWRMPAEREPHRRTWMAFPSQGYSLGDTAEEHHEARSAWAAVANAVSEFEPVVVVVDPAEVAAAKRYLGRAVDVLEAPLDDAWMRDMGPTFVLDDDGHVGGVDWVFNGWGAQEWANWEHDQEIGRFVLAHSGSAGDGTDVTVIDSSMVNEGGGIQVDGAGTVLVTETVQLDPGRNPDLTKEAVEAELRRTIGVDRVIWLPRGLTRDSDLYGTRGHVDICAALPSPGTALVHVQRDPGHPDHAVSQQLLSTLRDAHDAGGRQLDIIEVPAPKTLTDTGGFVDYSYLNHYVANGAVIACSFADPHDAEAAEILGAAYPGRQVVTVDARPIFERGGGIHCITQNEPSAVSR
ncbi:agmatine deiminase family protein [Gordonia hankookensis]|uniref:Agmatine deiminase family protein n=1 Tax=Gordonia hankookensis TaxID=589403 RepID=A0ABR7WHZ3_9ACTN|nr:agmatine deiminase family protein [Gordonia hankookensis]MBD1321527.1 agmatine deiminase family protein [Gordonia hankookensis]